MAGIFRFSNPASEISKLIQTYRSIYEHFSPLTQQGHYFNHKEASEYMAKSGLASSQGAIGEAAVRRSRRSDTSRDPLYNQHKMYSEIFRMLGWYEPGSKRTNFNLPEYGYYIASSPSDTASKLLSINLLHIVSPNPLISVRGGNVLRPFPLILKLMEELDGRLSRDEMILTVLACKNDKVAGYEKSAAKRVRNLRAQSPEALKKAIDSLKVSAQINSDDVLPNYTRFPIAALKWTEWAEKKSIKDYYGGKALPFWEITNKGLDTLEYVKNAIDIRFQDLIDYDYDEQAAFCIWSNIYHLSKAGYDTSSMSDSIKKLKKISSNIFNDFGIEDDSNLLFFGYQEAPRDILRRGDELIEE